ncbi:hypothetical protein TanjilG_18410 [Lupinus angustifolius]|uniref:Uncharacterized protein n=1 Tax=Lupinus angustifolius TaxID=3871 RepID=A0A4P1RWE5_LUPAN|nr:PREDICTED: myosin-G heavy chain-like isoform X1 [Lupinus angustifolius]OIW19600.1 hypothetical protein TanjilG_18410 [Lupinus angustifolius]
MIDMEGMKGGGRVGIGEDDIGDGMQCIDHPFRNNNKNNNPGGICAICLQEKLANLVSSSFPLPIRASTSSSSSPSFTSNNISSISNSTIRPISSASASSTAISVACPNNSAQKINGSESNHHDGRYYNHECYTRRTRIPFLLAKKKKKPSPTPNMSNIILKRSKSTAIPSSRGNSFVDNADHEDEDLTTPGKRNGFWSFLHLSSNSKKLKSKSLRDPTRISSTINAPTTSTLKPKEKCKSDVVIVEEDNNSSNSNTTTASVASFERKVSRSRSVGCGSRSFSGDFFERISTGFGDCTLRRVESQREGKNKVASSGAAMNRERVRCGGLFSGFMMTSSSSSSSSSSYWVSSSTTDNNNNNNNDSTMNNGKSVALSHGRSRNWGWAFASPMRVFTSKPSKDNRRDIIRNANDKNATPNLSAIPSLLSARS